MKKIVVSTTLMLSLALCSLGASFLQAAHPVKPFSNSTMQETQLATPENLEAFVMKAENYGSRLLSSSDQDKVDQDTPLFFLLEGKPGIARLFELLDHATEKNHDTLLIENRDTRKNLPIMRGADNIKKAYSIFKKNHPIFVKMDNLAKQIKELSKNTPISDPKLKALKSQLVELAVEEEVF